MINEEGTPTEILMDALELVEGASKIFIVLDKGDCIHVKSNCDFKESKWLIDQAGFIVMGDNFGIMNKREL